MRNIFNYLGLGNTNFVYTYNRKGKINNRAILNLKATAAMFGALFLATVVFALLTIGFTDIDVRGNWIIDWHSSALQLLVTKSIAACAIAFVSLMMFAILLDLFIKNKMINLVLNAVEIVCLIISLITACATINKIYNSSYTLPIGEKITKDVAFVFLIFWGILTFIIMLSELLTTLFSKFECEYEESARQKIKKSHSAWLMIFGDLLFLAVLIVIVELLSLSDESLTSDQIFTQPVVATIVLIAISLVLSICSLCIKSFKKLLSILALVFVTIAIAIIMGYGMPLVRIKIDDGGIAEQSTAFICTSVMYIVSIFSFLLCGFGLRGSLKSNLFNNTVANLKASGVTDKKIKKIIVKKSRI